MQMNFILHISDCGVLLAQARVLFYLQAHVADCWKVHPMNVTPTIIVNVTNEVFTIQSAILHVPNHAVNRNLTLYQ